MEFARDIFIALLTAHVLGDFVLQTKRDVARKHRARVMAKHVGIHALIAYFLVGLPSAVWIPLVVMVLHFLIDWFKIQFGERTPAWFLGDQAAHVLVLIVLASVAARFYDATVWHSTLPELIYPGLALFAGYVITVRVGGLTTQLVLAPYLREMQSRMDDEQLPWLRGFEDGGRIIGYLERTLLFAFVLAGSVTAVGFLVAAKAFFRIGEINKAENRLEAEYIIIGTLTSFAHGVLSAYAIVLLIR